MDKSSRLVIVLAGASGFMAVAAGAFGAHGVSDPIAKGWLETGGHYQLVHVAAALAALFLSQQGLARARLSAWLFLGGALVFSGTLYLMALGAPRWLGAITPIGGLMLLAGWAILGLAGLGARDRPS
jgi:uncharacterized membrane protein YgdD (TMEM256/DUF423 family)